MPSGTLVGAGRKASGVKPRGVRSLRNAQRSSPAVAGQGRNGVLALYVLGQAHHALHVKSTVINAAALGNTGSDDIDPDARLE